MAQYWPTKARNQSGAATLHCVVTKLGTVDRCVVVSESQPGLGFGEAALKMAPLFAMAPGTVDGTPVDGASVTIPIRFLMAPNAMPGHTVINPHWIKIPTANDLSNFWPPAAGRQGGVARIRCIVTIRGTLDKCTVESETPSGLGFGNAALLLAPLFMMSPQTVDGVPVGGAVIVIPIRFGRGPSPSPGDSIKVANSLAWSAAPTAAEMGAAFPSGAAGRAGSGHVVLRCAINREGGLHDCETMTEQPTGMGFARAARDLSKRFRVFDDPDYVKGTINLYVDVPFDFRDPARPVPPLELINPIWLQTADPAMAGALFPAEAAKAGLKTGRAILACQANHDGTIACTVDKEDPPGLGFGQAALSIAAVMKMNPWTQQGAPVDGAKIRLPIRVDLGEPAAPAPAK